MIVGVVKATCHANGKKGEASYGDFPDETSSTCFVFTANPPIVQPPAAQLPSTPILPRLAAKLRFVALDVGEAIHVAIEGGHGDAAFGGTGGKVSVAKVDIDLLNSRQGLEHPTALRQMKGGRVEDRRQSLRRRTAIRLIGGLERVENFRNRHRRDFEDEFPAVGVLNEPASNRTVIIVGLIQARNQHFDMLRQSTLIASITEQSTQLRIVQPKAA